MDDVKMEIIPGNKNLHVELDVGNLCLLAVARLNASINSNQVEDHLKTIAAEGVTLLIGEILKLPSEFHENVPVAKLPRPTTAIPREKEIPKPKPPTRWEKFVKEKGLRMRKKDKLVWDDVEKDWKPRYGYRGIKNSQSRAAWAIEVPNNADPNIDYFQKKNEDKKERIAKNEYQRLKNIAYNRKLKVTNLESVDHADKHQLSRSLAAAKTATASLGRFTDSLAKEKAPKNSMKKRKFMTNIPSNMKAEKENTLKILEALDKKKPKLDIQEAVEVHMQKGYTQRESVKKDGNQRRKKSFVNFKNRCRRFEMGQKKKSKKGRSK